MFGEYPQTIKASSVTVTAITDNRGYFLGSDGYYYAKVTATPYRNGYLFSTGITVSNDMIYYFKVEPIKWRILKENNEEALILCESIIVNKAFYNNIFSRIIDNRYVYSNNYKHSEIREWLNNEFYSTAFSALQQDLILITDVETVNIVQDIVLINTFVKTLMTIYFYQVIGK